MRDFFYLQQQALLAVFDKLRKDLLAKIVVAARYKDMEVFNSKIDALTYGRDLV